MEKKVPVLKVVRFFTIVTLYKFNWKKEVGSDISLKVNKNGVDIRFVAQGKSPNKVGEIIENNKIILKT